MSMNEHGRNGIKCSNAFWDRDTSVHAFQVRDEAEPHAIPIIRTCAVPRIRSKRPEHELICHSLIFCGVNRAEFMAVLREVYVSLQLTTKWHQERAFYTKVLCLSRLLKSSTLGLA
jgi:hypothetical protein